MTIPNNSSLKYVLPSAINSSGVFIRRRNSGVNGTRTSSIAIPSAPHMANIVLTRFFTSMKSPAPYAWLTLMLAPTASPVPTAEIIMLIWDKYATADTADAPICDAIMVSSILKSWFRLS